MSGKQIGLWLYDHWPMDAYATIVVTALLLWIVSLFYFRKRPEKRAFLETHLGWLFVQGVKLTGFVLASPWLVFRGLFFAKNGGNHYKFAPIRTMFLLASFVMVYRLATSGMSFEGVKMGPDVEVHQESVKKKEKKKRSVSKLKAKVMGFRPMVSINKVSFSNIKLYELLVLLIFCGMYYYRRDLTEGDQSDGLDSVLSFMWKAYAMKMSGNKWQDFAEGSKETIEAQPQKDVKKEEAKDTEVVEEARQGGMLYRGEDTEER